MKKKLLFVTLYLHTGGVEKSLLSLLEKLDYEKYEVDLLLFDHQGVLMDQIPKKVNLLPPLFESFSNPMRQALRQLYQSQKYKLLMGKVLAAGIGKLSKGAATGQRWMIYRSILPALTKEYDVAISYLDFFCNYYVAEKVSATKKILYNHMNYANEQGTGWPCPRLERRSFKKSDYIVSVAESSKQSLIQYFPEFKEKMHVIHNTISPETIHFLSHEALCERFLNNKAIFKIVTVARLAKEKGVFLALEACKQLVNKGHNISWFLIGTGQLFYELNDRVKREGLGDHFILLGEKSNPYPYMKHAHLYVQPSMTEAHCVAVEEALALNCRILATDIPSFQHQLNNTGNAQLVPPNAQCLANGIKDCMDAENKPQVTSPTNQLSFDKNWKEVEKFFHLIEK